VIANFHRASCAFLLLVLSACATPAIEEPHEDAGTRMQNVAARFEQARRRGGMAGVIADIDDCYKSATAPIIKVYSLRDCLVLDYVAFRTDVAIGRRLFHQALPFFEDQVFVRRTSHYAQIDGFTSPAQLANYFNDAGTLVQYDIGQINTPMIRGRQR